MKLLTPFFAVALLIGSNNVFAANQVVSTFGNHSSLCADGVYAELLLQYAEISEELRKLESENGDPERISILKIALEIVVDALNADEYGMTVVVLTDRDPLAEFNIPNLIIEGKTYPLAEVKVSGSSSQVQIIFKKLGICAFANSNDGSVGHSEIQRAVDHVLSEKK